MHSLNMLRLGKKVCVMIESSLQLKRSFMLRYNDFIVEVHIIFQYIDKEKKKMNKYIWEEKSNEFMNG